MIGWQLNYHVDYIRGLIIYNRYYKSVSEIYCGIIIQFSIYDISPTVLFKVKLK